MVATWHCRRRNIVRKRVELEIKWQDMRRPKVKPTVWNQQYFPNFHKVVQVTKLNRSAIVSQCKLCVWRTLTGRLAHTHTHAYTHTHTIVVIIVVIDCCWSRLSSSSSSLLSILFALYTTIYTDIIIIYLSALIHLSLSDFLSLSIYSYIIRLIDFFSTNNISFQFLYIHFFCFYLCNCFCINL